MQLTIKIAKKILIYALVLGVPVIGYLQRWSFYDYWRLRGYAAPAQVANLAEETTMLPSARRTFYVYKPALKDKSEFTQFCTSGEQTIVLGCYKPFDGIYMQNITDDRLTGVMQVTAAHEVLHAYYERLEPWEKTHIDNLLSQQYSKITDARIKDTISNYEKQGADINNELHSILGTEVRELSKELEDYYAQFFSNRLKIVEFSENYETAFTSRKDQVAKLDKQLEQIKSQIDSSSSSLNVKQEQLEQLQAELNKLLKQGRTQEYNAQVPHFNAQVQSYNSQVAEVRELIDKYNAIVKHRNEVALEQGELYQLIDSRPSAF